ncbi:MULTISPECIES: lipoprotein [Psychrobacter]|uniref:LPS translocon maturation chaperone LptM n=1 Tax=Psychrobacter TaxID=497 RepID=UPI00146C9037|nr:MULTISPECIES: lipoprotein [Psychrobacter]
MNSQNLRRVALIATGCFAALMITGCGQKGDLYLVKPESGALVTGSDATASTSDPQDAAFAKIDDNEVDSSRYLDKKASFAG